MSSRRTPILSRLAPLALCAAGSTEFALSCTAQRATEPPAQSAARRAPSDPVQAADVPSAAPQVVPRADEVQPASDEWKAVLAGIKVPDGYTATLWAAEPLLANAVGMCVDDHGAVYVAETFRCHHGVLDQRDHMQRLADDLACTTVEERVALYRRDAGDTFDAEFRTHSERVAKLVDSDGDGRADTSTIYADGFSDPADGLGAAVMALGSDVYFTCMPSLWKLGDADRDGLAETRDALSSGYGVQTAMIGHDLHGLRLGPDGRVYFSSGDRGMNVTTREGVHIQLRTGAILRCEPDGSDLEVFCSGLRNPQDLVFDAHGNLFTGDNNGDGGDEARLVHAVYGMSSGWHHPSQWVTSPTLRGPWNEDLLWKPHFDGQAAHIVPPIANVCSGPSGITIDPGTCTSEPWSERLLLIDFTGSIQHSPIRALELKPKGASFELVDQKEFASGILATDCEFGPDGALYVSDWVEGWRTTGKGRIWRIARNDLASDVRAAEVQASLARDATTLSLDELARELAHADMRLRIRAELELARRGSDGLAVLLRAARDEQANELTRLHGLWGAAVALRREHASADVVVPSLRALLHDANQEVRAQAASMLGDVRSAIAAPDLLALVDAAQPARVQLHAALALARIGWSVDPRPLYALLARACEKDATMRHAAAFALSRCTSGDDLANGFYGLHALSDPHEESRHSGPIADVLWEAGEHEAVGTVLALRYQRSPLLKRLLMSWWSAPRAGREAGRAIYDLSVGPTPQVNPTWRDALVALAEMLEDVRRDSAALARRALNAHFRLGSKENARALLVFACLDDAEPAYRKEALERLAQWTNPPNLDPVLGDYQPLAKREAPWLAGMAAEVSPGTIAAMPLDVARAWVAFAKAAQAIELAPRLAEMAAEPTRPGALRADCLEALGALRAVQAVDAATLGLKDKDGDVRAAALALVSRLDPASALPLVRAILAGGELAERRAAYALLAKSEAADARALLSAELARETQGLVPAELVLELVEAASAQRADAALAAALDARAVRHAGDDKLAPYLDALHGGDVERGRKIFREKGETTCMRCHKAENDEGGEVGPSLAGAGKRLGRLGLLEAIVEPNRRIASGYENSVWERANGTFVEGRLLSRDAGVIRLRNAQNEVVELAADEVLSSRATVSAMPQGLAPQLSLRELRDLVEYLATR
jgi:quinoprotein glucose dehydrogenase